MGKRFSWIRGQVDEVVKETSEGCLYYSCTCVEFQGGLVEETTEKPCLSGAH